MTAVATAPSPAAAILDPGSMTARLRDLLTPRGRLTVVAAAPLVWKPGSRGLVEYRLEGAGPRRVYGKHFAKPVRAARLFETWRALERADFGPDAGVPSLVGYLPELSLVLYVPVEGPMLADVRSPGAAERAARRAGDWLGRLQASGIRLQRRLDMEAEAENAGRWAARVGELRPAHAEAARELADDLSRWATRLPFACDAPVHKDFHYRHVVASARLSVVDFDEVRMGDRALDPAHFCTYLWLHGLRSGSRHGRTVERAFLDGYRARSGRRPGRAFTFFTAYSCMKIAKQLAQGSGVEPRPGGRERDRQLRLVLEHGLRQTGALR
jgi:aminoglycoside phosphotransferase (APT) family kinase protein